MSRRWWWPLWIALWLALSPSPAVGEDQGAKVTARQLFQEAGAAFEREDYATAADLYGRSNAIYPAPTAALGEARALVKLGRLLDAYERYGAIATTPLAADASAAFQQAVESARQERDLVLPRIPALVVTVDGQGDVTLDGNPLPPAAFGVKRLVNPGSHRISAPGVDQVVELREGQVLEVPIHIAAAAQSDPAPLPVAADADTGQGQLWTGYVLLGVGGASLIAAAVTAGLYTSARSTVDDECDEQSFCSQEGLDAVDRARALGTANLITFFGGIAAAGVGLTLVLTSEDGEQVSLRPSVTPQRAALTAAVRW